jgi:hypothetical protein
MIFEQGPLRISILPEVIDAVLGAADFARVEVPVSRSATCGQRVVVEIHRRVGGLPQRALIGGSFEPAADGRLSILAGLSGPTTSDRGAACQGNLGRELVRGLPSEFASSVIVGLLQRNLPSGLITIDRGAFDPVESSGVAFTLAASVLAEVVQADSLDGVEQRVTALFARMGPA